MAWSLGRRTSLALFDFLLLALVSGALAYDVGTNWVRVILIGHSVWPGDSGTVIEQLHLVKKRGGRRGDYSAG